jgi:hypothetical protein
MRGSVTCRIHKVMRPVEELSNVNAYGLGLTLLMGILILALPRRQVFYPIFIIALYVTLGQVAIIAGYHFTMMRVMIIFVWLRLLMRKEIEFSGLNAIDKTIILYGVCGFIVYVVLWGSYEGLKNRLGFLYNTFGLYFMFRFLIKDMDDIERAIKSLAVLVTPVAIVMAVEFLTQKNWFSVLGGVPQLADIRDGLVRAKGPFGHSILAGTFAATTLPLFIGSFLKNKTGRAVQAAGIVSVTLMTLSTGSGGALTSYMASVMGFFMWRLRRNMQAVRWMALFTLGGLAIFMKAPIWYLLAKVSSVVGGGGWHRSYLIEQAMNHIGEWWLIGTKVTAHWMPYALALYPTQADITNQFIAVGVDGGLITMFVFIGIIVFCFRGLGKARQFLWDASLSEGILVWSMGVALFSHIMSFMGVSYFDQIAVGWNLLLAAIAYISSITEEQWESILSEESEESA